MKSALLLASAAMLVAACTTPEPTTSASVHASGTTGPVDASGTRTSQAASNTAPWAAYRTFNFDSTTVEVSISDRLKLSEIVAYLESNPALDVGIDGTLGSEGSSEIDRNLSLRRTASVRLALMNAGGGVASYKIFTGAFANPDRRHAGQIQVLVGPRTGSYKPAQ